MKTLIAIALLYPLAVLAEDCPGNLPGKYDCQNQTIPRGMGTQVAEIDIQATSDGYETTQHLVGDHDDAHGQLVNGPYVDDRKIVLGEGHKPYDGGFGDEDPGAIYWRNFCENDELKVKTEILASLDRPPFDIHYVDFYSVDSAGNLNYTYGVQTEGFGGVDNVGTIACRRK